MEKVVRKMRGQLMPPGGSKQPASTEARAFISWVEGDLDAAGAAHPTPGHVPLHRLNRKEYANAVRDLLGVTIDPSTLLPRDDIREGFDNIASALQVTPAFVDQYVSAARNISVLADRQPPRADRRHDVPPVDGEHAVLPSGRPAARHARWLRRGPLLPRRRGIPAQRLEHGPVAVGLQHGVRERAWSSRSTARRCTRPASAAKTT